MEGAATQCAPPERTAREPHDIHALRRLLPGNLCVYVYCVSLFGVSYVYVDGVWSGVCASRHTWVITRVKPWGHATV